MNLSDLAALPLTYPHVGATAGIPPEDYHHIRASSRIGTGRERFDQAAQAVMRWGMQRGAGLGVQASADAAEPGAEVLVRMGPIRVPCRVVYVIDEPDRRGFAYGTLRGHPESGEELFAVRHDPASGAVYAEVAAFSRPATWWSKVGGPFTSLLQRLITRRYLRGI